MSSAEESTNESRSDEGRPPEREREREREREAVEEPVELIASATLRVVLLILGVVLLLFATGQAIGVDVLALLSDALDTRVARWLTVAVFGLILIMVALRGFRTRR